LAGIGKRHGVVWIFLSLFLMPTGDAVAQQRDAEEDAGDRIQSQQHETDSPITQPTEGAVADAVPSEAEQRELGADEDPMSASNVQRDVQREEEAEGDPERTTGFDIYGSVRIRYRDQEGASGLQDGGSRMGVEGEWQFTPGSFLIGRYEMGFNLLTGRAVEESRGNFKSSIFTRLFYVGLDAPNANLIVGKNWSPYYKVSGFTDRFQGAGGRAVGTYNALTDGGPTGTGRSDRAVQGRLSTDFLPHTVFKPFDLNLQLQHGNSIPFGSGAEYGTAVGLSAVMTTESNFSLGLAYNHASIDLKKDPSLRDIGLTGSARAMVLGTRAFDEHWYAAFTVARLKNHETTGEGIYFDGWGSEFFGKYRMTKYLWFVGGYNALEPDSDQARAGDFRVRYAMLGLWHVFDSKDSRLTVFANVRLNDGRNAAGTNLSNVYTIGIRWDLSKRGWHMSQ
jgi:predicted porin